MLLLAVVAAALAASPNPSPDPYQIYRSAMRNLAGLQQPAFIDVTETRVTTLAGGSGATDTRLLRAVFDSNTRRECVFLEPDDREAVIGSSYFAPDTWLMARRPAPSPEPSAPNAAPDLSDLKTIADVVATAQPAYTIVLAGTPTLESGARVDHLVLHPRDDPEKHNLRELWIDAQGRIVQAIIRGSYRPTPHDLLEQTYVLEDFGQVGPYWLVVRRIWTWAPPFSGVTLHFEATVRTMRFPASLPAWLFDEAAFRERSHDDVEAALGPPGSPQP